MATLDLNSLAGSAVDTEMEPTRRGRPADPNPFIDLVWVSYESETAKAVRVPKGDVSEKTGLDKNAVKVANLIRAAAREHNVGVSVQILDHSKTLSEVRFLGRERRASANGQEATEDEDQSED